MKKFKIQNIKDENTTTKTIRIKISLIDKLNELASKNNITTNRKRILIINSH